jgi:hypothetical protein
LEAAAVAGHGGPARARRAAPRPALPPLPTHRQHDLGSLPPSRPARLVSLPLPFLLGGLTRLPLVWDLVVPEVFQCFTYSKMCLLEENFRVDLTTPCCASFRWLRVALTLQTTKSLQKCVRKLLLFDPLVHRQLHDESTVYPFELMYACVSTFCRNGFTTFSLVPLQEQPAVVLLLKGLRSYKVLVIREYGGHEDLRGSGRRSVIPYVHE